jgi:hypothetical protein
VVGHGPHIKIALRELRRTGHRPPSTRHTRRRCGPSGDYCEGQRARPRGASDPPYSRRRRADRHNPRNLGHTRRGTIRISHGREGSEPPRRTSRSARRRRNQRNEVAGCAATAAGQRRSDPRAKRHQCFIVILHDLDKIWRADARRLANAIPLFPLASTSPRFAKSIRFFSTNVEACSSRSAQWPFDGAGDLTVVAIVVGLLSAWRASIGSQPSYPTATRYAFWQGRRQQAVEAGVAADARMPKTRREAGSCPDRQSP